MRIENISSAAPLPVYGPDNKVYKFSIKVYDGSAEHDLNYDIENIQDAEAVANAIQQQGYHDDQEKIEI